MLSTIGNASKSWVLQLFTNMSSYVTGDISASGSTLTVNLTDIGVKLVLSNSSNTISAAYYAIQGTISTIDIRRNTIYGGSGIESYTLDGGSLSTSGVTVDSTLYAQSNEVSEHYVRVNNIVYKLTIWLSGSGARSSVSYKRMVG